MWPDLNNACDQLFQIGITKMPRMWHDMNNPRRPPGVLANKQISSPERAQYGLGSRSVGAYSHYILLPPAGAGG